MTLVSTTDEGTQGDGFSAYPSLSADGARVAFTSQSVNLAEGDTDVDTDIYVKDLITGALTLATVTADGTQADAGSNRASLSGDGRRLAFWSYATNLGDGGDTEPTTADVYVKDLVSGEMTLASAADDGTDGDGHSSEASMSGDGTRVAFSSQALNLGEGDTDYSSDVYVKALSAQPPVEPPTCVGRSATVYVTAGRIVGGPDTGEPYAGELRGTDGDDVIVGTPEGDRVFAAGGADVVCALAGDDTVSGGAGGDRLLGGANGDNLGGGGGRDIVHGGNGADTLTGGRHADRFIGGKGTDTASDYTRRDGDTITGVP